MPTLYTNELILSFWLRLCRAGCFVVTSVSLISYKAIQLAGVLADDLVAHLREQVAQVALDELAPLGRAGAAASRSPAAAPPRCGSAPARRPRWRLPTPGSIGDPRAARCRASWRSRDRARRRA